MEANEDRTVSSGLTGIKQEPEPQQEDLSFLAPAEQEELVTMRVEDESPAFREEELSMRIHDREQINSSLMALHDEDAEESMPFLGNPEELELIEKINTGELNIFDAARQNDPDRIAKILEIKPELATRSDWGECTPLALACMLKSYEAAETLMKAGASAKVRDPLGKLPLDYILNPAKKAYMQRVADRFDRDNEDYLDDDSTVQGPTNEIRDAAFKGDMKKLDQLLTSHGLGLLKSQDKKGHTPLMFACMGQQIDCAFYLLERGADINQKTSYDQTADTFVIDRVHRTKVQSFAFKVSPKGRAMYGAMYARRRNEIKEAVADKTADVMDDIREVVKERENTLMLRARYLSEFAADWAENYYVEQGCKGAEKWRMDRWYEWQAELAREAQGREDMDSEEAYMRHYLFTCEQIAKRKAEEAERKRLEELAAKEASERAFREERDRMLAEARAEAAKQRQAQLERKVEAQALEEWEQLERESRQRLWHAHCETKPHKLKLYQRMRFAVTKTVNTQTRGNFLPNQHTFDNFGGGTWGPRKLKQEVLGHINYNQGEVDQVVLSLEEKDKILAMSYRAATPERRKTALMDNMRL